MDPETDDHALAVGAFTHSGQFSSAMTGGLLGLIGLLRGRQKAAGLPARMLMTLTARRLILEGADIRWRPRGLLGDFSLAETSIEVKEASLGPRLRLVSGDGRIIELQGVNRGASELAALLGHGTEGNNVCRHNCRDGAPFR
jgi:hypothetical protein